VREKEEASIDKLIATEWDLFTDLKDMLKNEELTPTEKIRLSNAIAYHATVLNKLFGQKGQEQQFNEDTLGDFIGKHYADGKMRRSIRRDFRDWTRKLSSTR
jgi:hypothetical protein